MLGLWLLTLSVLPQALSQSCIGPGVLSKSFNKCYYYFTSELSYREAEFVCTGLAKEGRLVAIHSESEQSLVYGDARQHFALNDYWIGLDDIDELHKWEWTDDVDSSYHDWSKGYPTTNTVDANCVATRVNTGEWYNTKCGGKRYFVCEANPNEYSVEVMGNVCGGRGLYSTYSQKCLYFMKSEQTYKQAQTTCLGIQGVLMNYDTAEKEKFAEGEIRQNMRDDIWICLGAPYGDGQWEWCNGEEFLYTHWANGYPSSVVTDTCVAALENSSRWYNTDCDSTKLSFACEADPLPGSYVRNSSDWTYFPNTQSLYYALPNSTVTTSPFDELEHRCVALGAHLASIHSLEELAFVYGISYTTASSVAIGCRTVNANSTCQWTDGTPYDYNGWSTNPSSSYNCAYLDRLYAWNPCVCTTTGRFSGVCKKPIYY